LQTMTTTKWKSKHLWICYHIYDMVIWTLTCPTQVWEKKKQVHSKTVEVYFVILCTRGFSIPTFDLANEYIYSEINHMIIMVVQPMKRSTNSGEWNMCLSNIPLFSILKNLLKRYYYLISFYECLHFSKLCLTVWSLSNSLFHFWNPVFKPGFWITVILPPAHCSLELRHHIQLADSE